MSNDISRHEVATRRLVYQAPGADTVLVRQHLPYLGSDGRTLAFDIYSAPAPEGARLPAVLLVTGFPDAGLYKVIGCHAKDTASYIGWCRLIAASGLAAIAYEIGRAHV